MGSNGAEAAAWNAALSIDVVELRVHGVSGTPAPSVLNDTSPRQVAGDQAGRVWRRSSPVQDPGSTQLRDVEAFHWGAFTKLTVLRFLWLILIPFTLMNLASFALLIEEQDAAPTRTGWGHFSDAFALRVIRLLGLAMTLQLVATTCYIGWQTGFVPWTWATGVRLLAGGALPAVLVLALWWLGRASYDQDPAGGAVAWTTERGAIFDRGFWSGSSACPRRLEQHVLAGLALVGIVGLTGTRPQWAAATGVQALYWLLLSASVGLLTLAIGRTLTDYDETKVAFDGQTQPESLWAKMERYCVVLAVALVIAVLILIWHSGDQPPSGGAAGQPAAAVSATASEVSVTVIACVLVGLLALLAVVSIFQRADSVGRRMREGTSTEPVPGAFRPYWSGMGATVLALVAVGLASGMSAAAFRWAQGTQSPLSAAAVVFRVGTICWGVVTALALAAALPVVALLRNHKRAAALWLAAEAVLGVAIWLDRNDFATPNWLDLAYVVALVAGVRAAKLTFTTDPQLAPHLEAGLGLSSAAPASPEVRRGRAQVRGQLAWAETRRYYHRVLGLAAAAAAGCVSWQAAVALQQLSQWGQLLPAGQDGRVALPQPSVGGVDLLSMPERFGSWVVALLATGVGALALMLWRKPGRGTTVAIVFDLLSLWPRVGHPLCPPPYGGRAVLGVATRASQLANTRTPGDEASSGGRPVGHGYRAVVVSGHSQGSLICVAAVAVLARAARAGNAADRSEWMSSGPAQATLGRVALLTYGSQLQFIYARLFPGYLGFHVLRGEFQDSLRGRWKNLHRWTDPMGGPVLAWPCDNDTWTGRRGPTPATQSWAWMLQRGEVAPGEHAKKGKNLDVRPVPQLELPWATGPDVQLQDPLTLSDSAYYPRLPARRHSDYWHDPYFGAVVWTLADAATAAGGPDINGDPTTTQEVQQRQAHI
ncbi:hypothetical protein LQK93_03494 [Terrabacter sp. BE26]